MVRFRFPLQTPHIMRGDCDHDNGEPQLFFIAFTIRGVAIVMIPTTTKRVSPESHAGMPETTTPKVVEALFAQAMRFTMSKSLLWRKEDFQTEKPIHGLKLRILHLK
jgi:hypothetical protein